MKTQLLLSALCALPLFGSAEIHAVRHDMYGGNANAWQMKRHAEKMNVVTNGGAKVVFIGDSITHFWESNGKAQLAKYFSEGDAKMLDLGISATERNTSSGADSTANSTAIARRRSFS